VGVCRATLSLCDDTKLSGSARKSIDYSHFNVQVDDLLFSLLRIVRIKVRPANTLRIWSQVDDLLFSLLRIVRIKVDLLIHFAFVTFYFHFNMQQLFVTKISRTKQKNAFRYFHMTIRIVRSQNCKLLFSVHMVRMKAENDQYTSRLCSFKRNAKCMCFSLRMCPSLRPLSPRSDTAPSSRQLIFRTATLPIQTQASLPRLSLRAARSS
jgi:hypothetical protein